MLVLALATAAFADPPLQITVPTNATKVALVCATRTVEAVPVRGLATFAEAPADCTVNVTYPIGKTSGSGIYTCAETSGCTMNDVPHAVIADASGRVNIVISGVYDTKWFELSCNNGAYRERGEIAENTTVFNGVPTGECSLYFKGGTPAQYRAISAGSWRCSLTGTTAVCSKFKP